MNQWRIQELTGRGGGDLYTPQLALICSKWVRGLLPLKILKSKASQMTHPRPLLFRANNGRFFVFETRRGGGAAALDPPL